ncbi:3-oxoacyl-ACP synthase [Aquimarina aggregata]|uniref:3-oxoacyl-ACP synthase n=1 Tax=Aquimarina aggregata TaxID=1642818 RepID=A0A163BJ59_9FLAO|nr:ketoacyl-ACP synthase III [Aquimarina aggregata]KZS41452.1 3-oxoacyl-ACP synthase [Aquimarina aggregata]
MGCEITHVEYYLPEEVFSNEDLKKEFPNTDLDKIEKIGIRSRSIASENQTSLDLAYNAAIKLLEKVDKANIDFLLFCTQTPDYLLPTSACILQDKLGLKKNIGALDFNLGCSGYIYGLAVAKGLIEAGIATKVLLLTGETYSKLINKNDRGNRTIFGDAGSATIISNSKINKLFNFELGTDGSGAENLIVRNGGVKNVKEIDPEIKKYGTDNHYTNNDLYMNGPEIFNFTIKNIPLLVKRTLISNGLDVNDLSYTIFHQANKFMLEYLKKKNKIPDSKFYIDLEDTGNTVSNTIPIALKRSLSKGYVKKGDKVLLAGFGVGYSWGSTIIEI